MKIGNFVDGLAGAKAREPVAASKVKETRNAAYSVTRRKPNLPVTKFVLAAVVVGAAFYVGMLYQKGHRATNLAQTQRQLQTQNSNGNSGFGGMGSGGGFGGGFGRGANISTAQVTAISGTSITVQDSSGSSSTYSITSDTRITDGGQQVAASDIQTGDSVIVIPERGDTSTARRIFVNPDFGQNQSNSQSTTVDPSQTQVD